METELDECTEKSVAEDSDGLKDNYSMSVDSGGFRGGPRRLCPPSPLGRRTDAVTVLLISDNGTVLLRRHRLNLYRDASIIISLFRQVLQRRQ